MEIFSCSGCGMDVGEEDLYCPFCHADLFEANPNQADELVDEEPAGPEPVEYRWVLVFAIVLVLGAWAWHALSDHASVLLK